MRTAGTGSFASKEHHFSAASPAAVLCGFRALCLHSQAVLLGRKDFGWIKRCWAGMR